MLTHPIKKEPCLIFGYFVKGIVGLWCTESFCCSFLFPSLFVFLSFLKGKKTKKNKNKKKNMGNHHSTVARIALMDAIEAQDLNEMKNHIKTLSSSSKEREREKEGFLSFRVPFPGPLLGLTPFHYCVKNNFVEGYSHFLLPPLSF